MASVSSNAAPRVMFLCYAVDESRIQEISRRNAYAPIQTYRFTWRLIRGVENAARVPVEVAAFAPVADFPGYPDVLIRHRRWSRDEGGTAEELAFVNIMGLKHLTRFFVATRRLVWWAREAPTVSSLVVNYGTASSQLFACLVARRLTNIRIVNVITDLPGVPNGREGFALRSLRRIDVWLTRRALARFDGIIALTRDLEREFAAGLPSLIVEGAVDPCGDGAGVSTAVAENVGSVAHVSSDLFVVTYAGGLAAESGVDNLLDAFAANPDPTMRLWVFGKGALADAVIARARADARITYFGFVSDEELESRMRASSVLVVPRPVAERMSPYVFPSKLLEYIMAGSPVAATRTAGIPEEYFEHIFSLGTGTPFDMAEGLAQVRRTTIEERRRRASAARAFVCRTRDYVTQGGRIWRFLQAIADYPSRAGGESRAPAATTSLTR